MKKALLSVLALLCLGLSPAFGQMKTAATQSRLDASAFSQSEPLSLSRLPGQQKYSAEEQQWWRRAIPTTRNAVTGNYIQDSHNNVMTPTAVTFMGMMTITAGTSANVVNINNFYGGGGTMAATVQPEAGTITIAGGQVIGTLDDGRTTLKLYLADFDQNHYYLDDMVAHVSPRGIISMPQAIIIASGEQNGQIRCYGDMWYKMNATQTDYSLWLEGENATQTYQVHFSRSTTSQILIKNFYGMGYPVQGSVDTVGNVQLPYTQVGVGKNSSGSTIVVRNYNVTAINYNTTPPTPTCDSKATPARFVADSIVTGPYCVAGSTSSNRVDLVLKSVIKVQPSDAFQPISTALNLPGKGTKEDPWQVSSAADLTAISVATNYNPGLRASKSVLKGAYFVQTADIDMDAIENFEPICADDGHQWNAVYDGNGHTIANLKVRQTRGNSYRAGLFGEIGDYGVVRNLNMKSADISTTNGFIGTVSGRCYGLLENIHVAGMKILMDNINSSYCGGITGYILNNGRIHDCSATGSIKGNNFVGGIAGNNNGAKVRRCVSAVNIERTPGNEENPHFGGVVACFTRDTAMVEDCVFTGTIQLIGNENVGGIVGNAVKGEINRCWNAGQFIHRASSSSTANIGGITGLADGARINDCLNTGVGQSYATSVIGGLAGKMTKESVIKGSLSLGTVMCAGDVRGNELAGSVDDGCSITDSYFDAQAGFRYGTEKGLATAILASGQLPEGFNASAWSVEAGKYPMLKHFTGHDRAALDRTPFFLAGNENVMGIRSNFTLGAADGVKWYLFHNQRYTTQGNGLTISGNDVKVTATTLTSDTIVALKGDYFRLIPVKVTPKEFDGEGTQASPYIIRDKADLDRVFKAVDVDLFDYSDTYFRLEGDIDFAGVTDFRGYSHLSPAYAFNGVLDGNGHRIKNLRMAQPTESGVSGSFMMYTGPKSVVRNFIVDESCSFAGGSNVAFVAAAQGRLEHIINLADVTALDNHAAGIVSLLYAGAEVVDCYNGGTVTGGHRYVGGIVAQAARGSLIQGCQNSGNVSAVNTIFNTKADDLIYIGGIVGDGEGKVTDCLNQGSVGGYAHVGGIAGSYTGSDANPVLRCLNTGVVLEGETNTTRGAIFGSTYSVSSVRVADNSFDVQFGAQAAAANSDLDGVSAMTTGELTSGNPVKGLAAGLWQFAAGRYPVLKAFASQSASQWYAATHVDFATTPGRESRFDKRNDAVIMMPQGTKASLAKGDVFSIVGNILRHPSSKEVAVDTIVFASADGRHTLRAPLFATPRLLDQGDGSQQNPWIISNANDWNMLAQYSNQYQKGFDSEYFRLGADIDFASGIEPICLGNAVFFNGIIDGNGKTIRNASYEDEDQKYVGLIGSAGVRARIFNLTMDSTCVFTGNQYVGAVAGHMEGEIYNVVNRATVSTSKMQYAGGIAGEIDGNAFIHHCTNYGKIASRANSGGGGITGQSCSSTTRVEDCVNYGAISAKGSCGGITGSSKGSIARCDNYGTIASSSTNAGGILGYFWCVDEPTVAYCKNYGKVTATGNVAGGIVGYMQGTGNILNCVNNVDVYSGGQYAGGILATANTSNTSWRISNVENRGNIEAGSYAGGILGYSNSSSKDKPSTLDSAANFGNVRTFKANYAGGIAGNVSNYVLLTNVYNYGDTVFTTTYSAGGIVGRSTGSVINAYNHADVTSTTYNAGGICGESNSSTITDYGCTIANAVNTGNVTSRGTTDANSYKIGGILGMGWVKIENCANLGDIKGRKAVAGIVGLPSKGKSATQFGTQVINCFSAGRVECTVEANRKTCGAVMGDSGSKVLYTNVENSYYDSQMAGNSLADSYYDMSLENVKGLTTMQLLKAPLGDGFSMAENAYPMPKVLASRDFAPVASAAVMLADGDNADNVRGSFKVSVPAGMVWSAPNMTFSGHGTAAWTAADLTARTPIVGSLGNMSRRVMLQLTSATGVGSLYGDNDAQVKEVMYFSLGGIRLAQPQNGVNIKVTIFNDGTRRSERIIVGDNK